MGKGGHFLYKAFEPTNLCLYMFTLENVLNAAVLVYCIIAYDYSFTNDLTCIKI